MLGEKKMECKNSTINMSPASEFNPDPSNTDLAQYLYNTSFKQSALHVIFNNPTLS